MADSAREPFPTPDDWYRFWSRVDKTEGCWNWTGCIASRGYGDYEVRGQRFLAHRIAYTAIAGEIPSGLVIDHLCRNRRCVNPAHMEPVTNKENILRGVSPTSINARKVFCPQGHLLSTETKCNGGHWQRFCRPCQVVWTRNYRQRRNRELRES